MSSPHCALPDFLTYKMSIISNESAFSSQQTQLAERNLDAVRREKVKEQFRRSGKRQVEETLDSLLQYDYLYHQRAHLLKHLDHNVLKLGMREVKLFHI